MEIVIHRKKQFSSKMVPLGIIVDYQKEKIVEIVNKRNVELSNCKNNSEKEEIIKKYNDIIEELPIYLINNDETIKIITHKKELISLLLRKD